MSDVNLDGPDHLIEQVLELPVEDLQTLLVAVHDRLRPLVKLINGTSEVVQKYDLNLTSVMAGKKIQTIKAVRKAGGYDALSGTVNIGLKEAKDMVEAVDKVGPIPVLIKVSLEEAEEGHRVLSAEGAGAVVVRGGAPVMQSPLVLDNDRICLRCNERYGKHHGSNCPDGTKNGWTYSG
jgi:ribosomal protein L7/L12